MRHSGTANTNSDKPDALWDRANTARYLGISIRTLDRLRAAGEGPCARKIRAQWRYRPADVYAYVEACGEDGGVAA